MKKRSKVIVIVAISLFVVLFASNFIYKLSVRPPVPANGDFYDHDFGQNQANIAYNEVPGLEGQVSNSFARKNVASMKMVVPQAGAISQVIDQKYERVASLNSLSGDYEADIAGMRKTITDLSAVVQSENASGMPGSRVLSLAIGVIPDNFEQAVERFKAIGKLISINVTKTDRTSDYLKLEAQRVTLEKNRASLIGMRRPNAPLDDLMTLETRILEVEGQIQDLGVSLGEFDAGNSLCTIYLSLSERPVKSYAPDVLGALFDALSWSVWVWFGIILATLLLAASVVVIGVLTEKIMGWKKLIQARWAASKPAESADKQV